MPNEKTQDPNPNNMVKTLLNIEKLLTRMDERVAWLYKEAQAGKLGGTPRPQKPVMEWPAVAADYEGPFAGFSKNREGGFSVVCPQDLIEEPHGTLKDEDDVEFLVVPVRTQAGEMYFTAIAADEKRRWMEGMFDNAGKQVTFCDIHKPLDTERVKAPLTQDAKDIEAINAEWDAANAVDDIQTEAANSQPNEDG